MLAASICREVHLAVLSSSMSSRVPRCLFGPPNSKETVELLQDALDMERARFARKWGVDPGSEDKENFQKKYDRTERSPRKRANPYSRQTNIHDYWRSRKVCDVSKKSMMSSIDSGKQQNIETSSTSN